MSIFKRSRNWLKKYSDLQPDSLSKNLRKRILTFKILRFFIIIASSIWLFIPTLETLMLGACGAIALLILSNIIEPKLDKDITKHINNQNT